MPRKFPIKMKFTNQVVFLLLFPHIFFAQTPLSGVINKYTKITAIDVCEGILVVTDTSGFEVGDWVLLVQMQGASINESNSSSFGDVTALGGAGLFEKNEIIDINDMEISLKYLVSADFDVVEAVQLVSFPQFSSAMVADSLFAKSWDGETGGIIAFEVQDQLTLEAPIDASGQGFRGAQTNPLISDCSFLTNANDYHYSISNWRGAPKGEGVASVIVGKEQGRGAQANGGGGGNDHNAGGGGGSNTTSAGSGGKQSVSGFGCDGDFPGKGGKALLNSANRIFLGGGGGAGHDNNGVATNGGNGGGIIIIVANSIVANGHEIRANGQSAITTNGDGAGGGGAGGTILIDAENAVDNLIVEANGGNGGNANNPSNRCLGPGGGGSGGRFISVLSNNVTMDLLGGMSGVNLTQSGQCNDPANGAENGQEGSLTPFGGFPGLLVEVQETEVVSQPENAENCVGMQVSFSFIMEGTLLEYQWQVNNGSGWQDVLLDPDFTGVNSQTLGVLNLDVSMDGFQFRCLVNGPCTSEISSQTAVLSIIPAPQAAFTFVDLGNGAIQFENSSQGANSFIWDFGDTNNSTLSDPEHTYTLDGIYEVVLTAFNACGEVSFSEIIEVGGFPNADFSADFMDPCTPLDVQFNNQSTGLNITSYFWEFEGGAPAISVLPNPIVAYSQEGDFDVKLIVQNSLGADTLLQQDFIHAIATPGPQFEYSVNGPIITFSNTSVGGTFWFWDFGDGDSSTELSPVHTYNAIGTYDASLTVGNQSCGATISQQIIIESPNAVDETTPFAIKILPNPTNGLLRISSERMVQNGSEVSLIDSNGKVLRHRLFDEKEMTLELHGLPTGLYILVVQIGERKHYFKVGKVD